MRQFESGCLPVKGIQTFYGLEGFRHCGKVFFGPFSTYPEKTQGQNKGDHATVFTNEGLL